MLLVLALGCGNTSADGTGESAHARSYDLDFGKVTVDGTVPSEFWPYAAPHRLDLNLGASPRARFCQRFGGWEDLDVTVKDDAYELSPPSANGGSAGMSPGVHLGSLRVLRSSNGEISGELETSGYGYAAGPEGWSTFTSVGTIGPDITAPSLSVSPTSQLPQDGGASMLPWEAVEVRASEPVDAAAFTSSVSTSAALSWSPLGFEFGDWTGQYQLLGVPTGLLPAGPLTVEVGAARDGSGNQGAAKSASIDVLDLGTAKSAHTLGASSTLPFWGKAAFFDAGAECAGQGCAMLGPELVEYGSSAGGKPAGFAGLLDATGATEVVVKYRVRVGAGDGPLPTAGETIAGRLNIPGQAELFISVKMEELMPLEPPEAGLTRVSKPAELRGAVSPASAVPFALSTGGALVGMPNTLNVAIEIYSVAVE